MPRPISILLFAAGLTVVAPAALAQPSDPYADVVTRAYARDKARFEWFSERAYFALSCGALRERAQADLIVLGLGDQLFREALNSRLPSPSGPSMIAAARERGEADAKRPGACDHWKTHPDELLALRQLGQMYEGAR